MMFVIGIVLFALAILISVALHECGHMWVARATGMKVRRYFVGFGPTLWSTRRGETEYGLKAVPLGGFCDIAGMTSVEELAPDEADRAMFKQATWKRVAVLFAGPGANFVICLVLLYAIALIWGLPNLHPPTKAIVGETACVAPEVAPGKLADCTGPGPAALAGIRPGDVIVKVGDTPVSTFDDMAAAIRKVHGNVPIVVDRDGTAITAYVDVTPTQRYLSGGSGPPGAPPPPPPVRAIRVRAAQAGPRSISPRRGLGWPKKTKNPPHSQCCPASPRMLLPPPPRHGACWSRGPPPMACTSAPTLVGMVTSALPTSTVRSPANTTLAGIAENTP